MSLVASTIDMGAHPAAALLIGGIAATVLRGRFASIALVLAPLFGLGYVASLEIGASSTMHLFGYEILGVVVDQQAKLFGYLFHVAALVAGIYSFHLRDPWQVSMSLFYAATAVGVAFAGDMLSLFLWWEGLAITSVFQIWGRKTKTAEEAGFRYLFFHVSSGLLLLAGILMRYHALGEEALEGGVEAAVALGAGLGVGLGLLLRIHQLGFGLTLHPLPRFLPPGLPAARAGRPRAGRARLCYRRH